MQRNARWTKRNESTAPMERGGQPHAIGEVLAELLARYEDRFPEANVAVVELPENFAMPVAVG